jgi:error-prone DNA polymerase
MYAELHCHSAFSFLDGASLPEQLALTASQLGLPALALTDHNGLYGSMAFAQEAKQLGLQAITGAEITLLDGSHVTLLAETAEGYANLCRLITEAHLGRADRRDPRLDFTSLETRHAGLIVLSGCREGLLPTVLRTQGRGAARRLAERCRAVFGSEHFFIELQRNYVRGDAGLTRALIGLAGDVRLSVVASGNVHYHTRSRHRLHDVLVAIRHRTTLDGSHNVRRANSEFFLRPPDDVHQLFRDCPDAVANTLALAERCKGFDLTRDLGYRFPDFHGVERAPAPQALAELCRAHLEERYPVGSEHRDEAERRLAEELRLVEHHGLSGFFLVYHDLFDLAREVAVDVRRGSRRAAGNLLPGRGRGSSVSSVVCYLLGLSHIDPVATRLFIGRFLNETLASVPDIDLDFPREIREELIRRVYTRYGHDHVGLVCSFPTYRLRSTVREIGKALDLPLGEIEQVAKLADRRSGGLSEEIEQLPGFTGRRNAPLWKELCELAEEIAGLPRHVSQHVGGMVISSRPLVEIVPLERAAMEDRVVCQWDKDSCDDARFIKIDFLALGMLSLVEECVELVATREGTPPDLSRIDFEDPAVFDRICRGDTVGLFQIESRAQMQMIRRTRPRNLEDLAVEVAIVRPGPIVGGAVNPYVRRREEQRRAREAGRRYAPPLDHPLLKDALAETLGVILYQDQVLQVCQALAGFTAGQAEALRRAMSRRRSRELMSGFWDEFKSGATARGVPERTAERVFTQVIAFSEFGFPKSHAAAFGLLAYQSAWLRHYHPAEYYCALFNNQPMGFYSLDVLGRDAMHNGVEIRLPDVNLSDVWCTTEKNGRGEMGEVHSDAVRVGLAFIRDWSEETATAVVEERERRGPFRSIGDFVRRAPPKLNRTAIEHLVWAGGCDGFGLTRRELLWQVGLWLPPETERGSDVRGRGGRRQLELPLNHPHEGLRFGGLEAAERLLAEYDVLGFAASGHPLSLLRGALPPGVVRSDTLPRLEHDSPVEVAGLVVARQRPETAKGFVFVLLEDEGGMTNVIVRPDVYDRYRSAVRGEPLLWVRGRLAKDDGTVNVIAEEAKGLHCGLQISDCGFEDPPAESAIHNPQSAMAFLKSMRRVAPESKDWG